MRSGLAVVAALGVACLGSGCAALQRTVVPLHPASRQAAEPLWMELVLNPGSATPSQASPAAPLEVGPMHRASAPPDRARASGEVVAGVHRIRIQRCRRGAPPPCGESERLLELEAELRIDQAAYARLVPTRYVVRGATRGHPWPVFRRPSQGARTFWPLYWPTSIGLLAWHQLDGRAKEMDFSVALDVEVVSVGAVETRAEIDLPLRVLRLSAEGVAADREQLLGLSSGYFSLAGAPFFNLRARVRERSGARSD